MQAQSVPIPAQDGAPVFPRRSGLSVRGWVLLGLIGATLFGVTILRLDRFVLAENHRDAPATAHILVRGLQERGAQSFGELLQEETLRRRLVDHRLLDEGRVLLRFGYLFQLVDGPESGSGRAILAWPWRFGRSGRRAFLCPLEGGTLAHENRAGWSGLDLRPDVRADGWRELPR